MYCVLSETERLFDVFSVLQQVYKHLLGEGQGRMRVLWDSEKSGDTFR